MRILVVGAETVPDATRKALGADADTVAVVAGPAAAAAAADCDMVLIDLDGAGTDAGALCHLLRVQRPELPIVVLGASDDEIDRVLAYELGADDYIRTPFSERELRARIRALARRAGLGATKDVAQPVGVQVRLDRRARRVFLAGNEVHLTTKEFDVLAFLCEDPGAARRRSEIIDHVWGGQWFGPTKTLDAHVAAIRRKLDGGLQITAIRGVGFRVDA
jgi:two-component system, OmpR family, response regulator RegX3